MCTNFLLIVSNVLYFTDQNFIILLKICHFLLKSDFKFILSTEYSEKICKNHFPIKLGVNCDHLKVFVSFGVLFHSLQTNNSDQTNNNKKKDFNFNKKSFSSNNSGHCRRHYLHHSPLLRHFPSLCNVRRLSRYLHFHCCCHFRSPFPTQGTSNII